MPSPLSEPQSTSPGAGASVSTFAPLKHRVFRMLWTAWLTANLCMWMNDVAAAWLMTTLAQNAVWVALVQTASTLPVFLLGLPSGALADIVDRRRYFMLTQAWVAGTGVLLALTSLLGALNAPLLLLLVFVNGIGLAMRWPVFAAIVPEVVQRRELTAALALNGIAMNASRIAGPIIAGALLAGIGAAAVFLLNALLSVMAAWLIFRWRYTPRTSALPGERFVGAMRVGLQYVRQSPPLRVILLRVFVFFLQASGLIALLPLVARQLHGGNAGTFTLLLACMGAGAILAASVMPRMRERFDRDQMVRYGTLVQAAATATVALAPNAWVAAPAMVVGGAAWISVANSLTISAQLALPDWVRARGMAIYQMALMGGSAAGAALWGQVASMTTLTTSMLAAAGSALVSTLLLRRQRVQSVEEMDFTPQRILREPVASIPVQPDDGPVMVTVEYSVREADARAFADVMEESRRSRLQLGALSWGLFRDASQPDRYIEYFVDESWVEHLRRFDRVTAADVQLRARRLAFHQGEQPPLVRRYVAQSLRT
jgi:MFS family permease